MNIKPISDLRDYSKVLKECEGNDPIILTKNGRGAYVVQDIKEYNKQMAILALMNKLAEAEEDIRKGNLVSFEEVKRSLGL